MSTTFATLTCMKNILLHVWSEILEWGVEHLIDHIYIFVGNKPSIKGFVVIYDFS